MKKHLLSKYFVTIFFVLFINSTVFGHEQIESIQQIPAKINLHCKRNPSLSPILFFDLDDTLIKSRHPQGWGSDKWFSAMYNYLKSNNIKNPLDIIFGAVTFVNAFFAGNKVEPFIIKTEEFVTNVLDSLKKSHLPIFGLTARTFILKDFTQKYLNNLGIKFSRIDGDTGEDIVINEETAWKVIYSNGTIFCSGNNKGEMILEFFNKLEGFTTKEIIVFAIDDQETNLDKIKHTLQEHNINCVCLHYKPKESVTSYELDATTRSWLDLIISNNQMPQ